MCTWGQLPGCLSSVLFAISQYSLDDTFDRKEKSFLRWGVLLLNLPGTVKSKLVRLREQQEQGCSWHRQSLCWPSWCRPSASESQNGLGWKGHHSVFHPPESPGPSWQGCSQPPSSPSLYWDWGLPWLVWRTLHVVLLSFMWLSRASSLSRFPWMSPCPSGTPAASLGLVSSANLLLLHLISLSMSLMKVINTTGPSLRDTTHSWFPPGHGAVWAEQGAGHHDSPREGESMDWIQGQSKRKSCRQAQLQRDRSGRGWVLKAKELLISNFWQLFRQNFLRECYLWELMSGAV